MPHRELTKEEQEKLRAKQRLEEKKANPWSDYNAHHCVMDGFDINYFMDLRINLSFKETS